MLLISDNTLLEVGSMVPILYCDELESKVLKDAPIVEYMNELEGIVLIESAGKGVFDE